MELLIHCVTALDGSRPHWSGGRTSAVDFCHLLNLPSFCPQYIHHRLIHLTPADYDDFVNIIRSARSAFCLTPVGMMQFNDVLQNLKRGKQTKELWQRISLEMATFSP